MVVVKITYTHTEQWDGKNKRSQTNKSTLFEVSLVAGQGSLQHVGFLAFGYKFNMRATWQQKDCDVVILDVELVTKVGDQFSSHWIITQFFIQK